VPAATYSRRSHAVSTVKKSQARIPAACWRRNDRQNTDKRARGSSRLSDANSARSVWVAGGPRVLAAGQLVRHQHVEADRVVSWVAASAGHAIGAGHPPSTSLITWMAEQYGEAKLRSK